MRMTHNGQEAGPQDVDAVVEQQAVLVGQQSEVDNGGRRPQQVAAQQRPDVAEGLVIGGGGGGEGHTRVSSMKLKRGSVTSMLTQQRVKEPCAMSGTRPLLTMRCARNG